MLIITNSQSNVDNSATLNATSNDLTTNNKKHRRSKQTQQNLQNLLQVLLLPRLHVGSSLQAHYPAPVISHDSLGLPASEECVYIVLCVYIYFSLAAFHLLFPSSPPRVFWSYSPGADDSCTSGIGAHLYLRLALMVLKAQSCRSAWLPPYHTYHFK